ncbi:electron transfer flavoprotein subunit beta/FixA family protein [Corynebacterium epidermidicanis]|uniref:Electron transfer flavoprotein subunit beta n=1 Tax=Corynebacterium epidermidicanis TaxID=1050174 RepID=A0A0G3GVM0_9CORY|nr:electron transfer flavoprotein subunit beta/FixA family protein [Corynebacterium epidermidicanis]AKK02907.1 electron transfer flavoprotein beta subunit [Corynebacterium epidermidicanis]
MPAIVVLVKQVPDTWSERTLNPDFTLHREGVDEVIDEINEFAVEQALRIRESDPNYQVVALAAGPERAQEALRKALAMGADQGILLSDPALAGSDVLGTAWALHNAINLVEDVALIITGAASSDGSMGAIPAVLSEYRQIPALTHLSQLAINGNQVTGVRVVAEGSYELQATLPAIASVGEKADKPRFPNFKGIMAAKKAEIRQLSLADIGVAAEQVGLNHAATAVTAAQPRPEREGGELVYADGAQAIVDFLVTEKFI